MRSLGETKKKLHREKLRLCRRLLEYDIDIILDTSLILTSFFSLYMAPLHGIPPVCHLIAVFT